MILNETVVRTNNESAQSQQDITLCKILIPPTGCYHHHKGREREIARAYSTVLSSTVSISQTLLLCLNMVHKFDL